jgi:hypothetical protein
MPIGAIHRAASPRYDDYLKEKWEPYLAAPDGEEKLNPAGRMALVLSDTPAFEACMWRFLTIALAFGILACRRLLRRPTRTRLAMGYAFGIGCLALGAGLLTQDVRIQLEWQFHTLAVGVFLAAAGFIACGIGSISLARQSANQTHVKAET